MLTSEHRSRDAHEPSGEPESLFGRMKGKMGDRVHHTKPEGLQEKKDKPSRFAHMLQYQGQIAVTYRTRASDATSSMVYSVACL